MIELAGSSAKRADTGAGRVGGCLRSCDTRPAARLVDDSALEDLVDQDLVHARWNSERLTLLELDWFSPGSELNARYPAAANVVEALGEELGKSPYGQYISRVAREEGTMDLGKRS